MKNKKLIYRLLAIVVALLLVVCVIIFAGDKDNKDNGDGSETTGQSFVGGNEDFGNGGVIVGGNDANIDGDIDMDINDLLG